MHADVPRRISFALSAWLGPNKSGASRRCWAVGLPGPARPAVALGIDAQGSFLTTTKNQNQVSNT